MRVQGIESQTNATLSSDINDWLFNHPRVVVLDIKYQIYPGHYSAHCALIIYRKEPES